MKKVLVLDFGGQYNLLVARRVRECGVYCEIRSWRESMENIRAFQPDALIFTGGPATVFEPNAPMVDPALFSMGIPVLGICYGQQLMIHLLGGQCRRAGTREYGKVELTHNGKSPLFKDIPATAVYWMSHGVEVETLAPGFEVVASTDGCRCAAIQCAEKQLYGVQFHPEVLHTQYGKELLQNFLYGICGFTAEWTMASYLEEAVAECRAKIGSGRVLLALSGGVDSSVAAALLQRAVGDQLTCIFVDHGLLRKDEGDQVEEVMTHQFHVDVRRVNAKDRFLSKLAGVTDPETKRKIIGEEFIRVFEAEAKKTGTGYHLSRCSGVRSGRRVRGHQEPPQCGRLARLRGLQGHRGAPTAAVQGRGAAAGHRAGPAGAAGVAPALPRPRSGHPCHR